MSAQRKHKQESVQVVRSISKFAGTLAGTTVGIGKKTPGIKAFVEVKALVAALESELDAANHERATLESELAIANRKLDKTRKKTKTQFNAFQAECDSLNSALKQAKNKSRGAKTKATKMSSHVDALETELAAANSQLVLTQKKAEKTNSQLSLQFKALQAKNDFLSSTLKQARNKTRGAKVKATRISGCVDTLRAELQPTANWPSYRKRPRKNKLNSKLCRQRLIR